MICRPSPHTRHSGKTLVIPATPRHSRGRGNPEKNKARPHSLPLDVQGGIKGGLERSIAVILAPAPSSPRTCTIIPSHLHHHSRAPAPSFPRTREPREKQSTSLEHQHRRKARRRAQRNHGNARRRPSHDLHPNFYRLEIAHSELPHYNALPQPSSTTASTTSPTHPATATP